MNELESYNPDKGEWVTVQPDFPIFGDFPIFAGTEPSPFVRTGFFGAAPSAGGWLRMCLSSCLATPPGCIPKLHTRISILRNKNIHLIRETILV
jgi:hypothetical protein